MEFPSNEITFGDFSNLKPEDEVFKILFGSRQTEGGRVEFPWDSKENCSYGAPEATDEDKLNQQHDMQEEINFSGETYFNQQDASGLHKSFSFGSDSYTEYTLDQSQMDMDGNNSSSSSKPYERRNKKRRPPGYYEKLQEEIEKERIRKLESNMHAENKTRNAVNFEETSYTSQSDRDTEQTQYIQKNHTDYAQNYASAPPVQNNFQTNISEGVELVRGDISRVTLSKDDSLAHSHMVHTTHENVSHPSMFHTSQTPIYPSQTSCPPPQTSVYTPQPWLPDSSQDTKTVTHNTNPTSSEHIDLSFTSVNKPTKSSISSGYKDSSQASQEIVTQVDSGVNQTNISEDVETESENLVDFASYPPLQPASNNIPIGAPGNRQESVEKSSEISNVEENSPAKQENSSGEQSASVWGAKPKSWANLFKGDSPSTAASVIYNENYVDVNYPSLDQEKDPKEKQIVNMSPVPAIHDSAADILGDFFCQNKIMHTQVGLQPRGLMNRGNWCYINATLQALISCPPFYNLMKKIPTFPPIRRGPTSTPILDSMIQFVGEFTPCARATTDKFKGKKQPPELPPGQMFEPTNVYKMLQVLQDTATFKLGRQEDAEEFLSCILDGMHEEMVACMRVHKGKQYEANGVIDNSGDEDVDPDSWEQVGPKKKSVLTRKNDFEVSPLADIFVGYIRSAVFKTTSKDSATVEPFFTLKLDIQSEKVCTVREALERMVSKESVSGFTCSKTNAEMEITKKLTIEQLPPVLILHLKCFVYDKDGGSQKLLKDVNFTIDLEITKDLLSPSVKNKYPNYYRQYKLFAVVYHHGKKATGGHYTTAVFHPAINRWVIFDDSNVKIVPVTTVLQFTAPRVPYLLYYRRLDSH